MTSLVLWALPEPPPASEGAVALWQQFLPDGAPEGLYSLPEEVHLDRDRLRAAYLAWLHEVGQRPRRGRSLRDRMQIRPGLSYWWMTIPADFSLEPDSPAYRAVRLMAFAGLADRLGARHVTLVTRDRWLALAVTEWAEATGRTMTRTRRVGAETAFRDSRARRLLGTLYRAVPPVAAARVVASMVRVPKHGRHPKHGVKGDGITFIDYLAHLGTSARQDGEFQSNYWGPLVPLLEELDDPISWLHISGEFATSAVVRADEKVVAAFNDSGSRQGHDLLHSHLTWGVIARSCLDYGRIVCFGLRAGARLRMFDDPSTRLSLWPVFREAYRDQFYGRTAMLNAFWLNLLHAAIKALPHQRLGIYLFENQPWEMALQHAWRQSGHGQLIGVGHTTALFWSTRLFKDPMDMWSHEGEAPMPWPDRVAVNGPLMRSVCERSGYPPSRMVDAEALRQFGGHEDPVAVHGAVPTVLILGEYSPEATSYLLSAVAQALKALDIPIAATFRPHPAAAPPVIDRDAGITTDPHPTIGISLSSANIVVCGALSTAGVDAAIRRKRVLVLSDPAIFLSSPAEGIQGCQLVHSAYELSRRLLEEGVFTGASTSPATGHFTLDPGLARWRALLAR